MGKRKDLTGMRFGRLTVISYNEEVSKQKKHSYWNCLCDCGSEVVVRGYSLTSRHTTSCGCYNREKASENIKDETGMKYGRLTVIKRVGSDKHRNALWLCKCDCGNEIIVKGDSLRSGHTTSCGCYNREKASDKMRELNEERWQGEEFRNRMSGGNHPGWKGGITTISDYFRNCTKQWDKDIRQYYNKQCVLTGVKCTTKNSTVHHLYGFNMIVQDAHDKYNIQVKPQVKDYTSEELELLENYVADWHKDTSNGVLLSKEVHKLFHNCKDEDGNVLYGYGDNTPEQFEEFKQRYLNGEFDNLLGGDLNV